MQILHHWEHSVHESSNHFAGRSDINVGLKVEPKLLVELDEKLRELQDNIGVMVLKQLKSPSAHLFNSILLAVVRVLAEEILMKDLGDIQRTQVKCLTLERSSVAYRVLHDVAGTRG